VTIMQVRQLKFLGYASLVLACMFLLVGAAWGDYRTSIAASGHAYHQGRQSALTLRGNPVPHNSSEAQVLAGLVSITAFPEPRAIVLLGTALLVGSGIARRRVVRNGKVSKD